MFSIKLVSPEHFEYPFFSQDYTDGRKTLMNFSRESVRIARAIGPGDRAIVYVIEEQKFVRAIEYTGTVDDGQAAALAHGDQIEMLPPKWGRVFLPIRFLAKTSLIRAPDYRVVLATAGVDFTPMHVPMTRITEEEYARLYNAMSEFWEWEA